MVALQSLLQELTASPSVPVLLWQRALGLFWPVLWIWFQFAGFSYGLFSCTSFYSSPPLSDSQSKLIPLSQVKEVLCAAWTSPVRLLDRKPFLPPPPLSLVLTSVASQSGWGATLLRRRVSDTWSLEESLVLINSLELRAVFLALKFLEVYVSGQSLLVSFGQRNNRVLYQFSGRFFSPPLFVF